MIITINGKPIKTEPNDTILKAAQKANIYIPTLCWHPELPIRKGSKPVEVIFQGQIKIENHSASAPEGRISEGCGLCVVAMADTGELQSACATNVSDGMKVLTDSAKVKTRRQENLLEILANHPHACLTCAQRQGCPRTQCSSNVPENQRCCPQLGNCELQKIADYVGISPVTPKWAPTTLPVLDDEPLFTRNYNLCVSCIRCVRACRDVRGVNAIGFVFDKDGKVTVGSVAPILKDSGCKFCTACVEVCPTGAIMDRDIRPAEKMKDLLPCVAACPAGVNIPWHLRFVAEGKADEAYSVIRERVPLPGTLGRVCERPCESACRRGSVNEPISICALKRSASDNETGVWKKANAKAPDTGKKVAIVGSGPAGLTTAFYLRKKGHAVTIFDSNDKPGGMMRYGIPRYRLPDAALDKDIGAIVELGVDLRSNVTVGKEVTLGQLRQDYDAVFVGVGAQLSRKIPIDGADLPQVLWGVDFLREVNTAQPVKLDGKVVVIGGGAVAIDAALTARRVGASEVHMVCLEDRHEMPAHEREVRQAEEEGVTIHNGWGPVEIVEQAAAVRGVCFEKRVCLFDSQGKFNPSYDDSCTMGVEADAVILAIGQSSDLNFAAAEGLTIQRNLLKVDEKTLETNVKGVFAGGDAVIFAGAIVHAVAAGRQAASAIDAYLGGSGAIEEKLVELPSLNPWLGRNEGFAYMHRAATRQIPLTQRTGFEEMDLGFGDGDAAAEAKRCLQCDLRLAMETIKPPPEHVLAFTAENVENVAEEEGVFRLLDEDSKPLVIKGTDNMRKLLLECLETSSNAKYFDYEEDKMFSRRESELIQQHLQKYGEMPGSGADEDDLF